MGIRIWMHAIGQKESPDRKVLSDSLLSCGIATCDLDEDVPREPGNSSDVLAFEGPAEMTREVLVRFKRRHEIDRIVKSPLEQKRRMS
jgi:hypothetical protein